MSDPADYNVCDEHESVYLKGDYCLECRIAELEAVIKLQKGAIAAKDKSSRRQIKKHTAEEDRVRELPEYMCNFPAIRKMGAAYRKRDVLALLGKESE